MKKIRNLTAITTMFLVLAFIGCGGGGSSSSDDTTPVPDQIYSAAGDWTVNATYTGDQSSLCQLILGPKYVGEVNIEQAGDIYTITFSSNIGDITATATRQENTLSFNKPVDIETIQGTAEGVINLTSDTTFNGTLNIDITSPGSTCQAVYDLTGNKNP